MAQQQENPIYWDQSASRWNLTLIFSLIVAVLGVVMAAPLLVILGIGMAGYSWLTTPRQFLLYRDSMVIVYGIPRTRTISFAEISHVELLALPLGERLRIRMISGSRLMLMMRDPGAFRGHLEDALARYHGEQSGAAYVEGTVLEGGDETVYETAGYEPHEAEPEYGAAGDARPAPLGSYSEERSGSYTDLQDEQQVATETYTAHAEPATTTSGSYTESAEPDFSGEGTPAYGADVETEAGNREDDDKKRPQSPY